ncbi:MAG: hypothetical protein IPI67_05695 [Myxococcales bacterium]|nr:hypothetical protein [Myxococcales bacterium]
MRNRVWCWCAATALAVAACGGGSDGDGEGGSLSAADPSCASGERWTGGNEESKLMHPGGTCISCHDEKGEGPTFGVAGTVYPAEHEKQDCFGASGSQVVLTGADGFSLTLDTNAAGNFMHKGSVPLPLTAKVVRAGKTREMLSPVNDGDCNGCHTESGDQGAPGRIFLP